MTTPDIDRLDDKARAARSRISSGVATLRERTDPQRLADEAMALASSQGEALTARAKSMASNHPLVLGAGVAAIGLALLTRHKLSQARVDLGDSADYTDYDDSFGPAPSVLTFRTMPSSEASNPDDTASGSGRNPFTSILLGLAAGALIGALMPGSQPDNE
ncbi:hypothetical protein [Polymorphobacter sp.]|uniref:hypothetical protein n=1 Tax=Polymorphobacter sp. TaxID=1909290 RepID=UPI003F6F4EC6